MWKNKIIEGYIYKIGEGTYTGKKGALTYGEMLIEDGFTDEQVQNSISRSETKSFNSNTKLKKLLKNEENEKQ